MKEVHSDTDVRIQFYVSPALSDRINRAGGQGGRGRFIRAAILRELEHVERNGERRNNEHSTSR